MKRALSLLLCVVFALSFAVPAMAAEQYADVSGDEWFADAANALRERGIMNGVEGNRFAPDATFTRAQLATVLYRMAGNPAVTGEDGFTDTEVGTWYSDAVLWASQNKIVNGIGGGLYGTNNATTQEQLVTMLWRNSGSYVLDREKYASDEGVENNASSWAFDAVVWAKAEALLTDAVTFEPQKAASRAQVADIVYRYLLLKEKYADVDAVSGATQKANEQSETQAGMAGGKVLIAYFSRAGENYSVGVIDEGNTAKLAKEIAAQTGGDLFEIVPAISGAEQQCPPRNQGYSRELR